jgi:hypothetical protein
MRRFLHWLQRRLGRFSPLTAIRLLPLGTTLDDAIAFYSDPSEAYQDEDMPDAMGFCFRERLVPKVVAWIWKDAIQAIVYYSDNSNPPMDLAAVLAAYGEGHKWATVNEGYLYFRGDGRLRLICSAVPIYDVGTAEYFNELYGPKESDEHKASAPEENG